MSERHAKPGDMPLFRWGAELRRARAARRKLRLRLAIGIIGIGFVLATAVVKPLLLLVWNVSESAPLGLYGVSRSAIPTRDDMVVAKLPQPVRELAAKRHYLPRNVPIIKRIAAGRGDFVCGVGETIYVNGALAATRRARDPRGRPMPWWTGCGKLQAGEYLLLMDDAPLSFDGRYFGPVSSSAVLGKATLLWAR